MRMLWWFLILGISLVLVVSVAISLYVRVRNQMKASAALKAESGGRNNSENSSPEA
ncbi:MAG: hypothetical protein WCC32_11820 [Terriglobales bacterium]